MKDKTATAKVSWYNTKHRSKYAEEREQDPEQDSESGKGERQHLHVVFVAKRSLLAKMRPFFAKKYLYASRAAQKASNPKECHYVPKSRRAPPSILINPLMTKLAELQNCMSMV